MFSSDDYFMPALVFAREYSARGAYKTRTGKKQPSSENNKPVSMHRCWSSLCAYAMPDGVRVLMLWPRSEWEAESEAAGLMVVTVARKNRADR